MCDVWGAIVADAFQENHNNLLPQEVSYITSEGHYTYMRVGAASRILCSGMIWPDQNAEPAVQPPRIKHYADHRLPLL